LADGPNWARGRTHRALLIGNAHLGGTTERFGPLRSPPGDVAALRAALTDAERGLHSRRHVQVVLDAPRERVLAALRAFFDGAGPEDQLLLFYSGHGLADERAALHLGSSDTMAQFPVSTAVPAEVIGQLADASPAAAVAIILDCRYGDAWPGSPSAALAGPQRHVLASPSGVPRADDHARVSAFTEVVAAGLTAGPAADRNRDGLVSFAELCAFVTAELTEAGDPPPECWLPNTAADVPIARVDDPARGRRAAAEESGWRLPGEEAPLAPVADVPPAPWGPEPPVPRGPEPAEPSPRRVPIRAALPAGPPVAPGRPAGQPASRPVAPAPHQGGDLPGFADEPVPGYVPAGPAERLGNPATEPGGLLAPPPGVPQATPAPEATPPPPPVPRWPDELAGGPDAGQGTGPASPPETAWPAELAPDPGADRTAGPAPQARRQPGPAWPDGDPDGGQGLRQVPGNGPHRPSGPAWPGDLDAGPRVHQDEVESNPYRPAGEGGSGALGASQRAFPSEILPPGRQGRAGPTGPAAATPGSVTAAPGPASGGPRRDRSRRESVAPTDIHRPGSQPAGADRSGPISNLPPAGPHGPDAGDALLAEIRRRVVERGERVLTLVGPGAVGPASAMVRYASRHSEEYEVCWWLRAHDLSLLAEDWRSLAAELGLPAHSDLLRAVPALRAWLEDERHGPWLLVLDGAPAPEEIAPYVPKAGRGQVLITATSPGWEELSSSTPLSTSQPRAADPRGLGAPAGPGGERRPPAGDPRHGMAPPPRPAGPPPGRAPGAPPPGPPPPPQPPMDGPWVERQPPRPAPPPRDDRPFQQGPPLPGPPPTPEPPAAQRPPEPPPVDDRWVERRPARPGPPPPAPSMPAPPPSPPSGMRGEPLRGEPVPPAAGGWPVAGPAVPNEPVNGRPGAGGPAGGAAGGSGRQEVLHWDQALKRLRRASPQAAALLQLAVFLDSEAIPVGLLAMTGVVLPGELGASLRNPQVFRAALETLAQRGMVAHAGDRVAVPPLAQVAVGSALGGEGVRTWAAYALRVLGIVLALPATEGERPAWAEPSRLLPHAEAASRHALALGVRTPELPTVLNEIGVHLLRMQRPDLAVPYLDRALGLAREVHGLRHREVVRALDHLALAHRRLGDEALAMRLHGEALAISRSLDRRLLHERGRYPGRP